MIVMRLDVLNEMEILVRGGEIGIVSKSAMAKIIIVRKSENEYSSNKWKCYK